MRLLAITQKVDKNDSVLGFFHVWLQKLSRQVDHLYVICLEKGEFQLPANVTVLSLGKENIKLKPFRKIVYWWRFRRYIQRYQNEYDNVFVHMNPEYVVLGGSFWKKHGKKILLWYVHKSVNWWLRLAEKWADKIFTASPESFRLRSTKLDITGHGIDVESFVKNTEEHIDQSELWCLAVGRVAPSKDLETAVIAISELLRKKILAHLSIVGNPVASRDYEYKKKIEALAGRVLLPGGQPAISFRSKRHYEQMPGVYHRHHLLIHTSQTGSLDKVVLEALASGRPVITTSDAYRSLAGGALQGIVFYSPSGNSKELANVIEKIYQSGILERIPLEKGMVYVRQHHNLDTLIDKIIAYLS